ncbi:hypothetical protein [Parabacteroides sp. FAFU027]|uniref:hypothetical protein n=1 Tax=Parabacteroides sp. FAFU027 TaxID=2922715 RepID=UPI001FAEEF29|nr:hypothetical protein [Parabacteroides sp. FAFU027]
MKRKQFVYTILSVMAMFILMVMPGCKNADEETPYTDYGVSVFEGYGDAKQAGLDTTLATGDTALARVRTKFYATLDNNSKVFTVRITWYNLPNAAIKAQIFSPADSSVFVSAYSMWDVNTALSGKSGWVVAYKMESTMLRDEDEVQLRAGKWYFTVTTADLDAVRSTSKAHTVPINGVSTVGYGIARGQVKFVRTFYKND